MMSTFRFVLGILMIIAIAISCTKDDETPTPSEQAPQLLLTFDPHVNASEVHQGDRFTNVHGCTVEYSKIRFYLSNVRLHKQGGEFTNLSEIELVDVQDHRRTLKFDIPEGDYTALSFDLGVPQQLNGTANPNFTTSVYNPTHPLSESNGMYWIWQTGYRFFIFEGRFDTIYGSSAANLPTTFAFHSGRDTLFRSVATFEHSFNARKGQSKHMMFAVDIEKIFAHNGDTINLWTEREFHGSLSQLDLGIRFANNTSSTFRLKP